MYSDISYIWTHILRCVHIYHVQQLRCYAPVTNFYLFSLWRFLHVFSSLSLFTHIFTCLSALRKQTSCFSLWICLSSKNKHRRYSLHLTPGQVCLQVEEQRLQQTLVELRLLLHQQQLLPPPQLLLLSSPLLFPPQMRLPLLKEICISQVVTQKK